MTNDNNNDILILILIFILIDISNYFNSILIFLFLIFFFITNYDCYFNHYNKYLPFYQLDQTYSLTFLIYVY